MISFLRAPLPVRRPMFFALIVFGGTSLLALLLRPCFIGSFCWGFSAMGGGLVLIAGRRLGHEKIKKKLHPRNQAVLAWMLFVFLLTVLRWNLIFWEDTQMARQKLILQGACLTIEEAEYQNALFSWRYTIKAEGLSGRVQVLHETGYPVNTRLTADLTLRPTENRNNPGEFDQKSQLRTQGIFYTGSIKNISAAETVRPTLLVLLRQLRGTLISRLRRLLPGPEGGVMAAMMLGEDRYLDPDWKNAFQKAGISHILVISGLHLGLVYSAAERIFSRVRDLRVKTVGKLIFLWFFALFTGFGVSTIRAACFCSIQTIKRWAGGSTDFRNTVFSAAFFMLLYQPYYALNSGFLLSFGCVLSLAVFSDWLHSFPAIPAILKKSTIPTLAVALGMTPITFYLFHQWCPYQFFLNLLVIPLVGILMVFGALLLGLSYPAFAAADFLGGALQLGWDALYWLVRRTLTLPGADLRIPSPSVGWIAVYILFWICIFHHKRWITYFEGRQKIMRITHGGKRSSRYSDKVPLRAGLLLSELFLVSVLFIVPFLQPKTRIAFLNVGQGDCCVIEDHGSVYLVDAGPAYSGAIRPYLMERGIRQIDGIFVSHYDQDHIEGVKKLLTDPDFHVETLYLPDSSVHDAEKQEELLSMAAESVFLSSESQLTAEDNGRRTQRLYVECLSPDPQHMYEDGNSASMVLKFTFYANSREKRSFLFCGDADLSAEKGFVHQAGRIDVLKCGHHGSSTSTGAELLNETRPRMAVISADREGGYGHPHAETLQRLEDAGCLIQVTDDVGAIQFEKGIFGWRCRTGK